MANKDNKADKLQQDIDRYPGVAVDAADKDRDNAALRKERTHTLNNNPRDHVFDYKKQS